MTSRGVSSNAIIIGSFSQFTAVSRAMTHYRHHEAGRLLIYINATHDGRWLLRAWRGNICGTDPPCALSLFPIASRE